MTEQQKYDLEILNRRLDAGFCSGSGDGKNTVSIEQAVALCAGLAVTDSPDSCVNPSVSAFGRRLNDRAWSSPKARAAGLREFAFAQLGTAGKVEGPKFSRRVAQLIVIEIVPGALREVRKLVKDESKWQRIDAAIAKADAAAEKIAKPYPDAAYAADAAADAAAAAAYAPHSKYRDKMLGRVAAIGVRALKEQLGDAMVVA